MLQSKFQMMQKRADVVLQRLEREYKEECRQHGSAGDKKFPYAVLLIRSNNRQQVEFGARLLHELLREETDDGGRAILYYLALAYFRLGNYVGARKHAEALLELEPHNRQARAMKALLDEQITKGAQPPARSRWCSPRLAATR